MSYVPRTRVDVERALAQHRDYAQALESLGCTVVALAAQDALPDAVFVEDMAVVLDEVAIMTRSGAKSRRAESPSVAQALAQYRPVVSMSTPATLDGGDVLRIGRVLYVGQSDRSNADGIAQLGQLVADYGYRVQPVPISGCLHLKSAVTQVAQDRVLLQPEWVDADAFADFQVIEVDPGEAHAANALRIGDQLLYPANFPRTRERLRAAGIAVTAVDVSELQKAEGATTCCSLVFAAWPAPPAGRR
nr:arginine deiminase-related protein [Luteimonas galliterrae]